MTPADLVRESQDPSTSAARLAELAQIDRGLWPAIAVHPAAYPSLLEWLGQQGDPTVNAVLALRSASPAPAPSAPPPPPTATSMPTPTPTPRAEGSNNKNFWLLGSMVAVVLVLIGGIAFGATQIFSGDDDKDTTAKDAPTPALTVDPHPSAVAPALGTPDTDSGDGDNANIGTFCEMFQQAQLTITNSPSGSASPGSSTVRELAGILRDIEEISPAEVKSDVGVLADYFETMINPSALDMTSKRELANDFATASRSLSIYYDDVCG